MSNTTDKKHDENCPYSKGAYFLDCECDYFKTTTDWEKEFDRHFLGSLDDCEHTPDEIKAGTWSIYAYAVKAFIRKRDTALWEAIEGLKKDESDHSLHLSDSCTGCHNASDNELLSDAQALIPNGKEV